MVLADSDDIDPILIPFLTSSEPAQAEAHLSQLIAQHSDTTVKQIIRNKLRVTLSQTDPGHSNQEALDLVSDVQAALVSRLQGLKSQRYKNSISDFNGYVATVSFNACNQLLRRKYPKRIQLKNKLRYLLSHEPKFAFWEVANDWLCGLAAWRGASRSVSAVQQIQRLREEQKFFKVAGDPNRQRHALVELLSAAFESLSGPVLLDELVSLTIDQLKIKEDTIVADDESATPLFTKSDSETKLESQAKLKRLWAEIGELPLHHRTALLLNLRDRDGSDALDLFLLARVATLHDLAGALEFQTEDFAKIWNELPWDDSRIANYLGLTRQQVINLRQSARARLARTLKPSG